MSDVWVANSLEVPNTGSWSTTSMPLHTQSVERHRQVCNAMTGRKASVDAASRDRDAFVATVLFLVKASYVNSDS